MMPRIPRKAVLILIISFQITTKRDIS